MKKSLLLSAALALGLAGTSFGASVPVTFTKLTGLTGGSPAATAVYRATIAANTLTSLLSISITDNSDHSAGADGQFSGFDLDAIKLSYSSVGTAAAADALVGLGGFSFGAGTVFAAGTQDAPADPKLFGTNAAGTNVNDAVATLGS
ncbi:MAG: PEP-CTERM sorting domain-containing protein, partial [Planctomycetota bacterium]|nr:PEP-CTERM sorting domain-containing protein [Planctomycetota bacterium]